MSAKTPARTESTAPGPWSVEDSLELYQVPAWGKGYFGINAAGHIVVRPDTTAEREIDLHEVVQGLSARDLIPGSTACRGRSCCLPRLPRGTRSPTGPVASPG